LYGTITRWNQTYFTSTTGKKGFVKLTKSFVKIGITNTFCYNNKMFIVLSTKRLVAAAKFLVAATKILSVIPNFVAETKPFFSVAIQICFLSCAPKSSTNTSDFSCRCQSTCSWSAYMVHLGRNTEKRG